MRERVGRGQERKRERGTERLGENLKIDRMIDTSNQTLLIL